MFTFGVEASWVDPSHFKFNLQLINFDLNAKGRSPSDERWTTYHCSRHASIDIIDSIIDWLNHWLIIELTSSICEVSNWAKLQLPADRCASCPRCDETIALQWIKTQSDTGLGLGLEETEKNLPPQCLYSVAAPLPLNPAFCWHSLTEHVSVWRSCHCGIPKKTRFRQQWTPEVPSAPAAVVSKAKVASVETSPAGVTWAQTDSHLKTTPSVSQLPGKCWHTHRQTGVQPKPLPLLFLNP